MTIPAGNITLADIFNMLSGIRVDIGRALEKIAAFDQRNKDADLFHAELKSNIVIMEERVTVLERFRWMILGAVTLIGIVTGLLSAVAFHVKL